MEYQLLLSGIENILGKGHKKSKDNYAFHCPFCNHQKRKLEINLLTDDKGENRFACWVCGARGKTIFSLLRQLKVPADQAAPVLSLIKKGTKYHYEVEEVVELPKEFQSLWKASTQSVIANKIRKYLYNRGLNDLDFIKYNIGYCTSGEFTGRIILPSYDEHNKLNFFTARTYEDSFYKYKNPSTSRDIIFFENLINWEQPLVLVEGPFDALAVRRNAIPLLGKTVSKTLMKKIVENKVKELYVVLDEDAKREALRLCDTFLSLGKQVHLVDLKGKDPSAIGFEQALDQIFRSPPMTTSDLIKYKVNL